MRVLFLRLGFTIYSNQLGFKIGRLPFSYLGVPIFKGKPKARHLRTLLDNVISKLAKWKGSLLSFVGIIQLVKSYVASMMVHSFAIYSWPKYLIKELERSIKNFIWSRDLSKTKLVIVAWSKVCIPFDQGGLGLRPISTLNEAFNFKLAWDLLSSSENWAILLKARVLKDGKPIQYNIASYIQRSIKNELVLVTSNTRNILGNGCNTNFWLNSWCAPPLVNLIQNQENINTHTMVSDFLHHGS